MRVRKVNSSGDMQFGRGQNDFWRNTPDAPAQAACSRLHLEEGEWFLDVEDGTPWRTRVLGNRTEDVRDPVIRNRVLDTPGVSAILTYGSVLNRDTRGWSVNMTIDTVYGRAALETRI